MDYVHALIYNARGHKLRIPTLEKAQFVTVTGIIKMLEFLWKYTGLYTNDP
jgi:hypothetical protein